MNPLLSAQGKCNEYESWISKSRWVSTMGCSASANHSLLSDAIKSPLQALRRESCYTAPLIDANLVLSPAAFFDERGSGESQTMIRVLCPSPLLPQHICSKCCYKYLILTTTVSNTSLLLGNEEQMCFCVSLQNHIDGNFTSKSTSKNMMPVPEGEHARVRLALQSEGKIFCTQLASKVPLTLAYSVDKHLLQEYLPMI